jgi:Na+/H+ antiporter NhaC
MKGRGAAACVAWAGAVAALAARGSGQSVDSVELSFRTLFTNERFGLGAEVDVSSLVAGSLLVWEVDVNGVVAASGNSTVEALSTDAEGLRLVCDSTPCRLVQHVSVEGLETSQAGTTEVTFTVSEAGAASSSSSSLAASSSSSSLSTSAQAISSGVSLIPLIIVITLAALTRQVEVSLAMGVFVGACIVTGGLVAGFKRFLGTYLIGAAADESRQFVIMFTFALSGLVGMIEKSGGMKGLAHNLLKYARSPTMAGLAAIAAGLLVFFDDYASCLVVGFSMRPVFDALSLSREKLAFVVDSTSAPIASLMPISSWVGFEISLIEIELARIQEANGGVMPDGLSESAFLTFVGTIQYRFYPILMLFLVTALVLFNRELGPMLIAERRTRVFQRTDGGDGGFKAGKELGALTAVAKDTPARMWNMIVPILVAVSLILVAMVNSGIETAAAEGNLAPSVQQIFEGTDPFGALFYGSFGASVATLVFYALQFRRNDEMVLPTPAALWRSATRSCCGKSHRRTTRKPQDAKYRGDAPEHERSRNDSSDNDSDDDDDDDTLVRPLLAPFQSVDAWLHGLARVFPATVVLVLAWATGIAQEEVGANRFFQHAIEQNITATGLPTITFIMSALMALATGTSWGTMTVIFPIVSLPAWTISQSADVVLATMAAILAGSVAGDHMSPISDTTVLSAISSECDLSKHVYTQAPYALIVFLLSILVGTLPIGYAVYPWWAALILGFIAVMLVVALLCAPIVCESGRYDPLTELYLLVRRACNCQDHDLEQLRKDTKIFAAGGDPAAPSLGSVEHHSSNHAAQV